MQQDISGETRGCNWYTNGLQNRDCGFESHRVCHSLPPRFLLGIFYSTIFYSCCSHATITGNVSFPSNPRMRTATLTIVHVLRGPESNRQSSGYEPDELPLLYPAMVSCNFVSVSQKRPCCKSILHYFRNTVQYVNGFLACFMRAFRELSA